MTQLDFNAHEVEPQSFEPIPAGRYNVVIVASEHKRSKSGNGSYLQLQMQVMDGEYKGRQLWERLNLVHTNQTAVQIARGKLSAICRAVGVMQPKDSIELHDLPMVVTVRLKKRQGTEELSNEFADFKPFVRGETLTQQLQPDQLAPWARK